MIRHHRVGTNRPPMFFALSMIALLVGCGEGTDALNSGSAEADVSEPDATLELGAALPSLGTPPTEISPSISAAQLLNDTTLPVSVAEAIAAGLVQIPPTATDNVAPVASPVVDVVAAPETANEQAATPALGAATPVAPVQAQPEAAQPAPAEPAPAEPEAAEPVTAQPAPAEPATAQPAPAEPEAAESEEVATAEAETTESEEVAAAEPETAESEEVAAAEPETAESEEATAAEPETAESEEVAEAEPETAESEEATAAEPEAAAAEPAVVQNESSERGETQFNGSTSPTFSGLILEDDTVQLDWEVDPTARGYNVYRDAEYINTVFENTYLDDFDAVDRNYYYEIQAFTADEEYSTIATGLTVQMTGTGRADPNAQEPNESLLDNYELVFSDEFNGESLDLSKWSTAYIWGDDLVINSELQHYVDLANDPDFGYSPFTFDGEAMTINTIRTPDELLEKANGQEYLSGVITSFDSFQFTYGYVEARAKVPFGKGYWPAFWLLNAFYDADRPEIDIMEFIGDNQDTVYHTFHWIDSDDQLHSTKSEPTFPIDYVADFHTFGAEWSPGKVVFYVDGIARHTIEDPKMSQEQMYIIANTAVGGWWPGDPDENTEFPGAYQIDYIRAYQRVGVQLDAPQFASPDSQVPARGDQDFATPAHLPSFEDFPEGYPNLQR